MHLVSGFRCAEALASLYPQGVVAEVRRPPASAARAETGLRSTWTVRTARTRNRESGESEPELITLHSGAGMWLRGLCKWVPVMPNKVGLRMCAANGTPIPELERDIIKFGGVSMSREQVDRSGFAWQAEVRELITAWTDAP